MTSVVQESFTEEVNLKERVFHRMNITSSTSAVSVWTVCACAGRQGRWGSCSPGNQGLWGQAGRRKLPGHMGNFNGPAEEFGLNLIDFFFFFFLKMSERRDLIQAAF